MTRRAGFIADDYAGCVRRELSVEKIKEQTQQIKQHTQTAGKTNKIEDVEGVEKRRRCGM
jgi:hypothetical protein